MPYKVNNKKHILNQILDMFKFMIRGRRHLKQLTLSFHDMLEISDLNQLYQYITETLIKHCEHAAILVSVVEEEKNLITPCYLSGVSPELLNEVNQIFGKPLLQSTSIMLPWHYTLYKSGKLNEFNGDFEELTYPFFDQNIAIKVKQLAGIKKMYTQGIVYNNVLFAVVQIYLLDKSPGFDTAFVEMFINQAGLFVQKKLVEVRLRESEAHLLNLANTGQALIWTSGLDRKTNFFNKPWLEFTGRTLEQELGDGWTAGVHPDDLKNCYHIYTTSFDARLPFRMDYRLKRYDGEYRWIQDNGSPMFDSKNEFCGYIGHCLDVTEIKTSQDQLQMFKLGIEHSDEIIYMTDPEGAIIYTNPSFEKVYGYSFQEVKGKNPSILKSGYFPEIGYQEFWKTILSKKTYQSEIINKTKDNRLVTIDGFISPILGKDEVIMGFLAVQHDITQRKTAEGHINKLSKAIEQSPVSVIISDIHGNIEYVNPYFSEITGYSREEILGASIYILRADDQVDKQEVWDIISSGKEWRGEFKNKKKNGEIYYESAVVSPVFNEAGVIVNFVSVKEDITERKKTEHDLLLNSERLQSLLNISDYNPDNSQELLNFALNEAVKLTESEVGFIHLYDEQTQMFQIGSWSKGVIERCTVGKSDGVCDLGNAGCWADVVRNKKPVLINDYHLHHTVAQGLPLGHVKLEKFLAVPVFSDKKVVAVIGVANKPEPYNQTDIAQLTVMMDSVWKIVERQKMIEELVTAKEKAIQSDHLKSAFLANMSHEIRTPMNAIMGFSELLSRAQLSPQMIIKYADIIHSRSSYLLALIDDILDLSKVEAGIMAVNKSVFNLNNLFDELGMQFRLKIKNMNKTIDLEVQKCLGPDESNLLCDKNRVQQLLTNLIDNAIKFTKHGRIQLAYQTDEQAGLIISVSDTGVGIPPRDQPKIFERFHKSNDYVLNYGGLGLGLSICKGIVTMLGGKIWFESIVNQGSTFYFSLPVQFLPAGKQMPVKKPEMVRLDGTEKPILLVEDDPYNIELFQSILTDTTIIVAMDGNAALKSFRENPDICLILMDIGLPDINGLEVTRAIRKAGGNIPVIALTAFVSEIDKQKCEDAGCDDFLPKPVESNLLIQKVLQYSKPAVI